MNTPSRRELLDLVQRIHPDFKPVWAPLSEDDQAALAGHFQPRKSTKQFIQPIRPRVVKWYCPFASQAQMPSGHRYCINVYVGCAHRCTYCYASGYEPDQPAPKKSFRQGIDRDMAELERFDVPPAPVHLSNSADAFQPLETLTGDTRYALEQILAHRHRFTTVTILTKNPTIPLQPGYLRLLKELLTLRPSHPSLRHLRRESHPPLQVQVSLAFWREEARAFYDPCAPPVAERVDAIRALHAEGIPVVLRIDPLFPRSPLPTHPRSTLRDFQLVEGQTIEDLQHLVTLAADVRARHVVYSSSRVVLPRGRKLGPTMQAMRAVYEAVSRPDKPIWRAGSWRLPPNVLKTHVVGPFLEICTSKRVNAKFCMQDLIEIP